MKNSPVVADILKPDSIEKREKRIRKKSKQIIEIPEYIAVERLKLYIDECDGDEIARLLGEIFGGECYQNNKETEIYNFRPDQYYSGEFNDLIKEKK